MRIRQLSRQNISAGFYIFNIWHSLIRFLLSGIWFGLLVSFTVVAQEDVTAPNAENNVEEIRYNWEQQYYGLLNGETALMFSHEMRNSKIAFADIDDDGDQDIFVGQANGEIAFFENRGTARVPDFVLITQQYKAIFEIKKQGRKVMIRNVIDVGGRSSPALVDIDYDGDFDLFIGSEEGKIWFFQNEGNNLIPVFKLITSKYEGIDVGRNSVPLFADVNLKRKYDMIVGTVEGKAWLLYNEGTRKKADFKALPPVKILEFGLETHASPGLFDWDEDGDLDMVVGQKNGTLSLFLNEGSVFDPRWEFSETSFQLIDIGGESAPTFVDIDADGILDMVLGSANPTAFLYTMREQEGKRILWNLSTNLFRYHKLIVTGNRAAIAAGDIDNDNDLDLIVGEKAGNLNYYENVGTDKEPNWSLRTEELIYITGIENSAPALGDLDNDGDLDLLIGEKQGQIVLVMNEGTREKPSWILKDQTYFQIDVGSNSVPRLIDIDGDEDLDLIIGNFGGRIILYMNIGTKETPVFAVESTRYTSAKVSRNAVPAFFDWDQNKATDMVIGNEEGRLNLMISPGKEAENTESWEARDRAFFTFNVYANSHPIFQDFNADGQQDLLLGNFDGDFLLFINKGFEGTNLEETLVVDNSIDQQEGSLMVEDVEGPVEIEIEEETDAFEDGLDELVVLEDQLPVRSKIDPRFVRVSIPLIINETLSRSTPTLGDLDQDGDLDMLIGSKGGEVYYYENRGNELEWQFQLISEDYLETGNLKNTAPVLKDLDQDGDLDLVLGTANGLLHFFDNRGSAESPNFVLEPGYFRGIWLEKDAKPTVLDIDDDGLLDILSGNFIGKLVFIRNDASRFDIVRRDYHHIDVDLDSAPFFADLDNDGAQELMIGSDGGDILFLKNDLPNLSGNWQPVPKFGGDQKFSQGSAPTAVDLDADGDLDLIVGSESGRIMLYRNDALIRESVQSLELKPLNEF